jgi:hypothetical protein
MGEAIISFDSTKIVRGWGAYKPSFCCFYYAKPGLRRLKPLTDKGFNIFLI